MKNSLKQFNARLVEAFSGPDHFVSHDRAAPILAEMAADTSVLHDLAEQTLAAGDFFTRLRINPVLALPIGQDRNYTLIGHAWIPLDDARTDLTHQSVHHHGKLLLTSMSAWGSGYESVLFKKGFEVQPDGTTRMEIDKIYKNPKGHREFVGQDTPHVVFFPAGFTMTYALWSKERHQTSALLKKIPGVQSYKHKIKKALGLLGLARAFDLNLVEKLDFYPENGRLIQMKDRVNYRPGTSENFVQNYFWCLQQMAFDRLGAIASRIREHGGHTQAEKLLRDLEAGNPIARKMEPGHLGIGRVQFTQRELLSCFPESEKYAMGR